MVPKDALDIYIEHRLLMEQRNHPDGDAEVARDARNKYPAELMRRLYVFAGYRFSVTSLDNWLMILMGMPAIGPKYVPVVVVVPVLHMLNRTRLLHTTLYSVLLYTILQ